MEGRRFEEADGEQAEKGKGAVRGDALRWADCRAVWFRGMGVVRRFIFDVRKSGNAGVMRADWNGVQIWACVAIAWRKNGGAVEATMLGGKGLTAQLVRRKNDAGGG